MMAMSHKPRIGLLGVGWIGRNRLDSLVQADVAEVVAISDPSAEMTTAASALAPRAAVVPTVDAVLELGVDGVMIATPSAQHAAQAIHALNHGVAVFCQKPLGRSAAETRAVIDAARAANVLLAVDLSYRFTEGMAKIEKLIRSGDIGTIFSADLVFHNAYGPDKPWFYDRTLAGGGCVMDLGAHLVDLCLWILDFPAVLDVTARLFARGDRWSGAGQEVEDYALVRLDLESGTAVHLACSWNLHVGRDAVISATFHGTHGGLQLRNVNGSFYDLAAMLHCGTAHTILTRPPNSWGGRAAVAWAKRLAARESFDPEAEHLLKTAAVIDAIYEKAGGGLL